MILCWMPISMVLQAFTVLLLWMELRPASFHKLTWSFSSVWKRNEGYMFICMSYCLFKKHCKNINLTACYGFSRWVKDAAHDLFLNVFHLIESLVLHWTQSIGLVYLQMSDVCLVLLTEIWQTHFEVISNTQICMYRCTYDRSLFMVESIWDFLILLNFWTQWCLAQNISLKGLFLCIFTHGFQPETV